MTTAPFARRARVAWMSAWPCWLVLVFAALAAVSLLPGGYARAAVAVPILLTVPGSVTLGGLFSPRQRPQGPAFVCSMLLLSLLWAVFASLILYLLKVAITAWSTYWMLLAVSAILAAVAESRLLLSRPPAGRQGASAGPRARAGAGELGRPRLTTARTASWGWAAAAVAGGVALLGGGIYAQAQLPRPAAGGGYTWLAWTGPRITGVSTIGPHGIELHFQVVHHGSGTAAYRLRAIWMSTPARSLTAPMTVRIGPYRTFHGALFIPPLPDDCTYRVVVTLTALRQLDPLTRHPQTWSVNADVHDRDKPARTCPR